MLLKLSISNYILIETLEFDFSDGFMVVTGETGAGKSIFIHALSLLLGERLNKDVLGPYQKQTIIEGVFVFKDESKALNKLKESGFEGPEFIFTRLIEDSGKSVMRINRQLVTLNFVREIVGDEVDIHSQFNTQSLLNEKTHLDVLDQRLEEVDLINEVKDKYQAYQKLQKEKRDFLNTQLSEAEVETLSFEIKQLEKLNLVMNEDIEILEQLDALKQQQESLKDAYEIMNGLENVDYQQLYPLVNSNTALNELISSAYYQLDEAYQQANKVIHSLSFDEALFNQLNVRLFEINQVKRRMRMDLSEILEYIDQTKRQLEDSMDIDRTIKSFDKKIDEAYQNYLVRARQLSQIRRIKANELCSEIINHGIDLNLDKMKFEVEFINQESERGLETVRFLVSMNETMAAGPLSLVASGGELSRLMLILKVIFNRSKEEKLIIFDEIDAGVSGKVALLMGQKMVELSKNHRVLAVTHLPLVAAFGDTHYHVFKEEDGKVVFEKLNEEQRVNELAIMLSSVVNETSLLGAQDLLVQTKELKK